MSTSNIRKTMSPVGVRLTTSERRALDELAKRLGLSNAETFRHLLREAGQPPRLAPGSVVFVVGPNREYHVTGLATDGAEAELHLETVDGEDWTGDRIGAMTEPAEDAPVDEAAEESAAEVEDDDASESTEADA